MKLKDDEQVVRGYVLTKDQIKEARKLYRTIKKMPLETERFPGELESYREDWRAIHDLETKLDALKKSINEIINQRIARIVPQKETTFSEKLNAFKERGKCSWKSFLYSYAIWLGDDRQA